jgi:Reverse transcriptase (RNA-dependent DNA polymerase)
MDTIVPKQAGFYGKHFSASHGVRQGDFMSPAIFNIVADAAVIRDCEAESNGRSPVDVLFYADDGMIAGEDPKAVQLLLDLYTTKFLRLDLK